MPIIAAGIVNKQGKILISRQFADISRIRIEGLLSAFPKLLGTGNKQCTFVETGSVRYVYQPVENLLLVLVTTKNSNIVEDLATLRLMGQLIPEYVQAIDEDSISAKAFEVLFAFDEVVVGGHREHNTIENILTYLEMQSHEEEVAKEEKRQQEELAKKESKKRERELAAKRKEMAYGGVGAHNFGRGDEGGSGGSYGGVGGSRQDDEPAPRFATVVEDAPKQAPKPRAVGGMSLGRARKADATLKVLQETGGAAPGPSQAAAAAAGLPSSMQQDSSADTSGILLRVEEKISATLNRDGGASNVDVRGDLFITISDAQLASVRILLGRITEDFNFRTHPNINKNLFASDRVLAIKDGKPYPTHQTLGILKWRLQNPGRVRAPISVTCWPGDTSATVEFELENPQATLLQVAVVIPLSGASFAGAEASVGDFQVTQGNVVWNIGTVNASSSSGSLEIALASEATDGAFFPMQVHFNARANIAGVVVSEVVGTETGVPVRFTSETLLSAEEYQVL